MFAMYMVIMTIEIQAKGWGGLQNRAFNFTRRREIRGGRVCTKPWRMVRWGGRKRWGQKDVPDRENSTWAKPGSARLPGVLPEQEVVNAPMENRAEKEAGEDKWKPGRSLWTGLWCGSREGNKSQARKGTGCVSAAGPDGTSLFLVDLGRGAAAPRCFENLCTHWVVTFTLSSRILLAFPKFSAKHYSEHFSVVWLLFCPCFWNLWTLAAPGISGPWGQQKGPGDGRDEK